MKQITIHNISRPLISPLRAGYCDSFLCRLRGLSFRKSLPSGEGLLLVQGRESRLDSAIHMLGVWIDLAVIWINRELRVVDARLARKWRPIYIPRRPARYVLEVSPERLDEFQNGDELQFEFAHRN